MDRDSVKNIIVKSLISLESVDEKAQSEIITMDETFPLFGFDARLDSLDLVSVITDVEEALSDHLDYFLSLTDDAALSREVSPFDTIGTLLDYCQELIEIRKT
jgi:acyl carrier protein